MAQRRLIVGERYLKGEPQWKIAESFGVDPGVISRDLKALHATWVASSIEATEQRKARELQKVDAVERAAWEGWTRSLEPREITLTEATEGGDKKLPGRKASVRKEGQAGDPRFLERVQKCIDQRIAILGIGAEQEALAAASTGLAALLAAAKVQRDGGAAPSVMAEA